MRSTLKNIHRNGLMIAVAALAFCIGFAVVGDPDTWPPCAQGCITFGPGHGNNTNSCEQCCLGCLSIHSNESYNTCVSCCNRYNGGDPNGPHHCSEDTANPDNPLDPPTP
jgi:hypothetical protein